MQRKNPEEKSLLEIISRLFLYLSLASDEPVRYKRLELPTLPGDAFSSKQFGIRFVRRFPARWQKLKQGESSCQAFSSSTRLLMVSFTLF